MRQSLFSLLLTICPGFSVSAATLLHSFDLTVSTNDQVGSVNLVSDGGSVLPGIGYVFAAQQGLRNAVGDTLLNPTDYTIFLRFKFDAVGSSGYTKLVDLTNLNGGLLFGGGTSDPGLYVHSQNIQWYNAPFAGTPLINTGVFSDVVITRDGSTNSFNGYINGALQFSFIDPNGTTTFQNNPNNIVRFFEDDNPSGNSESSSGTAQLIQIFGGALTGAEVAQLPSAVTGVPEPGSIGLIVGGALLLGFARRSVKIG